MEKKAVIDEENTPPEDTEAKQASETNLEDHATKRLAEIAERATKVCTKNCGCKNEKQ